MRRAGLALLFGMITAAPHALAVDQALPDAARITDEANKYFTGKGAPQDDARAVALYNQAANLGYARAMHNLGYIGNAKLFSGVRIFNFPGLVGNV